ncbi:MAG: ribbon-helix-helix protein, CopG family [Oscillospiraceae bacterium]|nr:ribbon-helix-helix protein, CopG family [Oscillospiraceae bacterium]
MNDKKFIIKPKTTKTITMTIRIDEEINDKLDELSLKSNRSRNELVNTALRYAFENLEFIDVKNESPESQDTDPT